MKKDTKSLKPFRKISIYQNIQSMKINKFLMYFFPGEQNKRKN